MTHRLDAVSEPTENPDILTDRPAAQARRGDAAVRSRGLFNRAMARSAVSGRVGVAALLGIALTAAGSGLAVSVARAGGDATATPPPSPVTAATASSAAAGTPAKTASSAPASASNASSAAAPAAKGDVQLTASADTYVVRSQPTALRGSRNYVFATSGENRAFLRFETKNVVPTGKKITGATLSVFVLNSDVPQAGFEVHPASSGWDERTLSYRTRPAYQPKAVSKVTAVTREGVWLSVPLTDLSAITTTGATAFELLHAVSNSRLQLASRESGKAPQLALTLANDTAAGGGGGSDAGPVPASTGVLPFDLPSAAVLGGSKKLAFAHYFTPFPISLDNKDPASDYYARNYLAPTGESGKHAKYAGLLRDRPLPRAPLSGDWQLKDFQTEVKQARAAGLDGFAVDVLSLTSYHWDRVKLLLDAAHRADPTFKIMLMPDMTTLAGQPSTTLATSMAELGAYPAAFHLPDGRLVVSPFKAEAKSPSWWSGWLGTMKSRGSSVAFVPTILDWQAHAKAYASISYGFSHWGLSSPATNQDQGKHAELAHSMGKIFMAPAKVQDVRPSQGQYQEAGNTQTLRLSWQGVIDGDADWVDMPTWNDYSEGTSIAPSVKHGWAYLDITSYYLTRWKTGKSPAVVRDGLYLTHRNQLVGAKPSFTSSKPMTLRSGSTPAQDSVEVLAFLTKAATVTVRVGSSTYTWDAPAGVNAKTFPLKVGTVSATATRSGALTASVTSPYEVLSKPAVQDLQYDAVSSLRR